MRRVQLAKRIAESTASEVGQVANEVRQVRLEVEAVVTQMESAKGTIASQVALFSAQAEASATRVADVMEERVQQLTAYSDAQTSRVTARVTQRLESEIQAAMTSTAATMEIRMCDAVEGMRREVQATIAKSGGLASTQ